MLLFERRRVEWVSAASRTPLETTRRLSHTNTNSPLAFLLEIQLAAMKMGELSTTPGRARMPQAEKRPNR